MPSGEQNIPFGVIHPPVKGVRENSPFGFGLEASGTKLENVLIAEKIGVKWIRGITDDVDPPIVNPAPGVFWTQDQIDKVRAQILALREHGILCLGYINYNMPWNVEPIPGRTDYGRHENRPHDLEAHAEMVYRTIAPLQDLVKNWEIWNEPWIHGWTWNTGDAQDYRDMTKLIWDKVKPRFPDVNIIGGGSVSFNRDILYAPGSKDTGYVDGSVSHAYGVPDPGQLAWTTLQKIMDQKWSKTKGRAGLWQTELGTAEGYFPDLPEDQRKYMVAKTLAPTYLLHMLAAGDTPIHIFWFSLSFDTRYSGDEYNVYDYKTLSPKPAVLAYATMTHFLEDSKLEEELYPKAKALWGFLFRRQDGKGTAAIYADKEYSGEILLKQAKGIKLYDYLGKQLADGTQERLTIKLNPWETNYVVSDLPAEALASLLKSAEYRIVPAVIVSPLSFTRPVSIRNPLEIQVENASPVKVKGVLSVTAPNGWRLGRTSLPTGDLAPGQKIVLRFWPRKVTVDKNNRYLVRYRLKLDNGLVVEGEQTVQVAFAPFKTIEVDGDLSDWQGVIPVTMVSPASRDYRSMFNDPAMLGAALAQGLPDNAVYQAWTAWDDRHFYFAARVPDLNHVSNRTFAEDPYAFPFWADSVMLAFDCMEKNPDDFLLGLPHYEKALASDLDYEFIAILAQGNVPELHRQCAPGTNYQTYYPTNAPLDPPLGTMDATEAGGREGKIKIVRDEEKKVTIYEIAISWQALSALRAKLAALRPGRFLQVNFAFAVNDFGDGGKGTTYWTKEAGQVQSGSYAFAPFWGTGMKESGGRIVTRWGFGK